MQTTSCTRPKSTSLWLDGHPSKGGTENVAGAGNHDIYAHGDTPLPWHTAIGSGISRSINYNDVRDWAANSGGCQNVTIPGYAVPQCGMDSLRMLPQARTPAKTGFGQQDQPSRAEAARRQAVHQLRLHNPSNHCYANAVVLGFMWACRTNDTEVMREDGVLHRLQGAALQDSQVMLWQLPEWQAIVRLWGRAPSTA